MSNSSLGELLSVSLSPSLVKEFISCSRAFLFRKIHHLSLLPPTESIQNVLTQEKVDNFTSGFFSTLKYQWDEITVPTTRSDLVYLLNTNFFTFLDVYTKNEEKAYRELDEKVFTLLSWLVQHLWTKFTASNRQYFLPIMVNQFINAPNLNLHGRPSAVFLHPDQSSLILIQTFREEFQHTRILFILQACIYARILATMGMKAKNFLFVNYRSMDLTFRCFTPTDFEELDNFLENFESSIKEQNFDPPNSPPCEICEFKLICHNPE